MITIKKQMVFIVLSTLILRGNACSSTGLVDDPGFDAWDENSLSAWQVDEGSIAKAATWHSEDYGVEMVGAPVQISQVLNVSRTGGKCFEFYLMSDVEPSSGVWVGVDFNDDGEADIKQMLTGGGFQTSEFQIPEPSWFYQARFIIRKEGEGRAILAEMAIRRVDSCAGGPLDVARVDGAPCELDSQCVSGQCGDARVFTFSSDASVEKRCGGCANDAACGDGQVCNQIMQTNIGPSPSCELPAPLGDACVSGQACQSGICCKGVCSECCDGDGCNEGESCSHYDFLPLDDTDLNDEEREVVESLEEFSGSSLFSSISMPFQCSPGLGIQAAGEACWADGDCASGVCESEALFKVCMGNRHPCETSADCGDGLLNVCVPLGESNGICQ